MASRTNAMTTNVLVATEDEKDPNFQRTPSYRIATTTNGAEKRSTESGRPQQRQEDHQIGAKTNMAYEQTADGESNEHWINYDDHQYTAEGQPQPLRQGGAWGPNRRDSYAASTNTANSAAWNTTASSSAVVIPAVSTVVPRTAGYGDQQQAHYVQRRGSFMNATHHDEPEAFARPNRSCSTVTVSGKMVRAIKNFKKAFFARHTDDDSHEKDSKHQLVNEPDPTYLRRWISLWLTWIIMFILVLQFSMYSSTLGTYLPLIDPTAYDGFAPWAIAAFGFGQTFACPAFGWWSNYIKNNRLPMAAGVALMIVGNIGYCMVEAFPANNRKWLVFFFRVIIGLGGGIAGVIRAYCATAAKPHEYTKAVTGATAGLSLAIMAGPGVQAMFAPIGYPGVSLGIMRLHMYNAPALASILIGVVCLIMLYTVLIQEYPGLAKDEKKEKDRFFVLPKYDMGAAWVIIFCWFAAYLTLTSFVMIGKSYTMVMFHWSYVQAVVDNGIIMGVFACISLVIFIVYAYHGKKFDERFLMYLGIAMMCAFFLITFPWPGLPRLHQECGELPCCHEPGLEDGTVCVDLRTINKTNLVEVSRAVAMRAQNHDHGPPPPDQQQDRRTIDHDDFPGGCQAVKYHWCDSATREPIGLYMGTFFLLSVGFPLANCAFSALFSKVIGPRRQGFMQGVIIAGGAAARTSGPIFINYTFDWWGPRVSWGLTAAILAASIALSAYYYNRLVPLNPKPKLNPGEHFRYKNGVLYRF